MKRIVIGRATDSDIIIPDEHDNVSRHHAVISFSFFGKMTISDTSSNGTLINGTRMLKGASVPVTRNDKIQLGGAWMFDWNLVEDPYRKTRQICYIVAALLFLFVIGLTAWSVYNSQKEAKTDTIIIPKAPAVSSEEEWNKDSTKNHAPTEISITTPKNPKENNSQKHKKIVPQRVTKNKQKQANRKEPLDENLTKRDYSSEKNMPAIN